MWLSVGTGLPCPRVPRSYHHYRTLTSNITESSSEHLFWVFIPFYSNTPWILISSSGKCTSHFCNIAHSVICSGSHLSWLSMTLPGFVPQCFNVRVPMEVGYYRWLGGGLLQLSIWWTFTWEESWHYCRHDKQHFQPATKCKAHI